MSAKTYAAQTTQYHGQTFVVEIQEDTLTLAVVNSDKSIKKLSVSATITEAKKLDASMLRFLHQPRFECTVAGDTITSNQRREGSFESADEEKKWLKNIVAGKLLDRELITLFPGNVAKQYAD